MRSKYDKGLGRNRQLNGGAVRSRRTTRGPKEGKRLLGRAAIRHCRWECLRGVQVPVDAVRNAHSPEPGCEALAIGAEDYRRLVDTLFVEAD